MNELRDKIMIIFQEYLNKTHKNIIMLEERKTFYKIIDKLFKEINEKFNTNYSNDEVIKELNNMLEEDDCIVYIFEANIQGNEKTLVEGRIKDVLSYKSK